MPATNLLLSVLLASAPILVYETRGSVVASKGRHAAPLVLLKDGVRGGTAITAFDVRGDCKILLAGGHLGGSVSTGVLETAQISSGLELVSRRVLYRADGVLSGPVYSPDGRALAVVNTSRKLILVLDADSGVVVREIPGLLAGWLGNGDLLIYAHASNGVRGWCHVVQRVTGAGDMATSEACGGKLVVFPAVGQQPEDAPLIVLSEKATEGLFLLKKDGMRKTDQTIASIPRPVGCKDGLVFWDSAFRPVSLVKEASDWNFRQGGVCVQELSAWNEARALSAGNALVTKAQTCVPP